MYLKCVYNVVLGKGKKTNDDDDTDTVCKMCIKCIQNVCKMYAKSIEM